jgi:hypothetical protein
MNNAMSKHTKEGRAQKAIMNNTTSIYKKGERKENRCEQHHKQMLKDGKEYKTI